MTSRTSFIIANRSCRCVVIVSRLATLSAAEVQLGQHDDDQSRTKCEVERVELDWDGHGCLIDGS